MNWKYEMKQYMVEELKAVFSLTLLILSIAAFFYFVIGTAIFVKKTECRKWNGDYHWSTGCIVKYKGNPIMLEDYKEVLKAEVSKPIPTNTNVKLSAE